MLFLSLDPRRPTSRPLQSTPGGDAGNGPGHPVLTSETTILKLRGITSCAGTLGRRPPQSIVRCHPLQDNRTRHRIRPKNANQRKRQALRASDPGNSPGIMQFEIRFAELPYLTSRTPALRTKSAKKSEIPRREPGDQVEVSACLRERRGGHGVCPRHRPAQMGETPARVETIVSSSEGPARDAGWHWWLVHQCHPARAGAGSSFPPRATREAAQLDITCSLTIRCVKCTNEPRAGVRPSRTRRTRSREARPKRLLKATSRRSGTTDESRAYERLTAHKRAAHGAGASERMKPPAGGGKRTVGTRVYGR